MAGVSQQAMMASYAAVSGPPISIVFQNSYPQAGGTNYTIPVAFGDDLAGRSVLVAAYINSNSGNNRTVNTLTVGGVNALPAPINQYVDDTGVDHLVMAVASGVSGTTGNVVINFSGSITVLVLGVWAMYGSQSIIPIDTAFNAFPFGSGVKSVTIDSLAGGAVWGACVTVAGDWPEFAAGIPTEDFTGSNRCGGFKLVASDTVNETISVEQGPSGSGTWRGVLGAVSFR